MAFTVYNPNSSVELFFNTYDSTRTLVDVTNPIALIYKNDVDTQITTTITNISTGYYSGVFTTIGQTEGLFRINFTGTYNTESIVVEGNFGLAEISTIQYYVNLVRLKLYDHIPALYKLDPKTKKFLDSEIYDQLALTLNMINVTGPLITNWSFDNVPVWSWLIIGATASCLESRVVLEVFNKLQYSDGVSLTIDRVGGLSAAAAVLRAQFTAGVIAYKRARPGPPLGLGTARLPYRVSRPLSLLPQYGQLYGN